jgi:hypothetical protein
MQKCRKILTRHLLWPQPQEEMLLKLQISCYTTKLIIIILVCYMNKIIQIFFAFCPWSVHRNRITHFYGSVQGVCHNYKHIRINQSYSWKFIVLTCDWWRRNEVSCKVKQAMRAIAKDLVQCFQYSFLSHVFSKIFRLKYSCNKHFLNAKRVFYNKVVIPCCA